MNYFAPKRLLELGAHAAWVIQPRSYKAALKLFKYDISKKITKME